MTKTLIKNYYYDDNDTNIIKIEKGKSASYLYSSFLHSHTCLEICLVLDNDITYSIDNVIYEAKQNEIIIVNAVQEHKILTPQKQINALFLHIPFFESNKIVNKELSLLIKNFYSNKINNLSYKSIRLTANLLNIIVALLDCAIDNKDIEFTKQKIDILYYIENNYKTLTLEQISNYFSYNKSYFSRLFKMLFNINFHEFLLNYKLNKAINDIKFTNLTIEEIALNNGFNSYFRFSQNFKKRYNTTPTLIRKNSKI